MNINETKSILIEAHEQLCSFAKSLYSLGFDEDYFDFEFEWIQMCVGLCEIYSASTDEFVKSRALKKLNAFLENDNSDTQLSFNFTDSAKSNRVKAVRPTKENTMSLDFESVNFIDD
jgi:hypothetical protein